MTGIAQSVSTPAAVQTSVGLEICYMKNKSTFFKCVRYVEDLTHLQSKLELNLFNPSKKELDSKALIVAPDEKDPKTTICFAIEKTECVVRVKREELEAYVRGNGQKNLLFNASSGKQIRIAFVDKCWNSTCLKVDKLKACEACGLAKYCSDTCNQAMWEKHKEDCYVTVEDISITFDEKCIMVDKPATIEKPESTEKKS